MESPECYWSDKPAFGTGNWKILGLGRLSNDGHIDRDQTTTSAEPALDFFFE
jgi:hypothetical protein